MYFKFSVSWSSIYTIKKPGRQYKSSKYVNIDNSRFTWHSTFCKSIIIWCKYSLKRHNVAKKHTFERQQVLTIPKVGFFLFLQLKLGIVISKPSLFGSSLVHPWCVCPDRTNLGLICLRSCIVASLLKHSHPSLNLSFFIKSGAASKSVQSASDCLYKG